MLRHFGERLGVGRKLEESSSSVTFDSLCRVERDAQTYRAEPPDAEIGVLPGYEGILSARKEVVGVGPARVSVDINNETILEIQVLCFFDGRCRLSCERPPTECHQSIDS